LCGSSFTQKYGVRLGKQRYKCWVCKRIFTGGKQSLPTALWDEYTKGKQTYVQLAEKYGCSVRTIQRRLDLHQVQKKDVKPRKVVVLMDTTYWGRSFGLMLFKDARSKENLLWYYVRSETNLLYIKGVNELRSKGFKIDAIVCDGRRGLIWIHRTKLTPLRGANLVASTGTLIYCHSGGC